jgi:hypothetical protein
LNSPSFTPHLSTYELWEWFNVNLDFLNRNCKKVSSPATISAFSIQDATMMQYIEQKTQQKHTVVFLLSQMQLIGHCIARN